MMLLSKLMFMPADSQKTVTIYKTLWEGIIANFEAHEEEYRSVNVTSYTGLLNYIIELYLGERVASVGDLMRKLEEIEKKMDKMVLLA